jgi:histidinol-phosphate/aromatic aminotransferase/cobyric acid decarboxylase-like protein
MSGLVKLNTNESPFGPSPRVLEAIRGEAADSLRLYPDPQANALRAALATYHQVRPEQVFVGNGSDEVLAHAFCALLKHDAPLLFPDITYSFYAVYCRLFGIAYQAVPLDQIMKDSFNCYPLGRPAQAGAIASLADEAYFQQSRARVIESRERLNRGLLRLGFEVLQSSANFVFARHPAHGGAALAAALRHRAVIVRHFAAPRISDYLRITVGTDAQIDQLLSALSDIFRSDNSL